MKKKILLILSFVIFFNLGNILDLTGFMKKSDVIVVLGGGGDIRIKKGLELYEKGFSYSNKIVITGNSFINKSEKFKSYFKNSTISIDSVVRITNVTNTVEELEKVKKYLLDRNFKSVIFVTHPTHTLRIKILANILEDYDEENIRISFFSADHTNVWSRQFYFLELESIKLVLLEYLKIVYNLIKYSIFL